MLCKLQSAADPVSVCQAPKSQDPEHAQKDAVATTKTAKKEEGTQAIAARLRETKTTHQAEWVSSTPKTFQMDLKHAGFGYFTISWLGILRFGEAIQHT